MLPPAARRRRTLVIILDNASIHVCKYIREFAARTKGLHLLCLPTYSPEYNPIEQVWKWLKAKVCCLPKAIDGGAREIISRIRKIVYAWQNRTLAKVPKVGIGIWKDLLVNYI